MLPMPVAPGPHDALEGLRQTIRKFAMFVIGISSFTLLSGGLTIITSCLSIVMGDWLLRLAANRQSFSAALHSELVSGKRGCCSCAGPMGPLRGMAIAVVTVALFTLLIYVPAFSIVGSLNSTYTTTYSCYTDRYSGTCNIYWYPPGGYYGLNIP